MHMRRRIHAYEEEDTCDDNERSIHIFKSTQCPTHDRGGHKVCACAYVCVCVYYI
jgi:hypothetical protein